MINILFEEAILYRNGNNRVIRLIDIPKQKDFTEVIEHLYCPGKGCEAKLVFNQRSTGVNYLSKHRAYEHSESCEYLKDGVTLVRSITEYIEENGGISDEGIQRRKKEDMNFLDEYFQPAKDDTNKKKKPRRKYSKKKELDPKGEIDTKVAIKVNYTPGASVIKKDGEDDDIKVIEPRFYRRLPHQLSSKDRNKNLRTSVKLTKVMVKSNYCEIEGIFEDVNVRFILPEAFFTGSERKISSNQLMEYLLILSEYIGNKDKELYMTTMCQSQSIELENIELYVLEPDFMSFQVINGRHFSSLTNLAVAISTKVI